MYIKFPPQISPSVQLLPPPGPSVLLLSTDDVSLPQGQGTSTEAQLFLAALKVRFEVFVIEQHFSAANEIDTDDATSWHWIIYAIPSPPPNDRPPRAWLESPSPVGKAPEEGEGNNNNEYKNDNKNNNNNNNRKIKDDESESVIPVATIRLVPFSPSPPTAAAGPPSGEGGAATAEQQQQQQPTHTATKMWNGTEAYIKLGRLATLRSHRGLGFGRVLIDSALKWAVENASTLSSSVRRQPPRVTGEGEGEGEKENDEEKDEEEEKEDKEGNGWNGLVLVHAQRDVEAWYRSVGGFVTDEGMGFWMEDGIEHVGMWRRLDLRGKREGERVVPHL